MNGTRWLRCDDGEWTELLASAGPHDVYHLAGYHRVAQASGGGEARLHVVGDGRGWIALPLLLRPIEEMAGRCDATSVYGYAGPVTSRTPVGPDLVARFRETLLESLVERGAVTLFNRLHPLLDQMPLVRGMGEIEQLGDTISIDLLQPEAAQLAAYRGNHRRDLARLERKGFRTTLTEGAGELDRFVALYHENMRRVRAEPRYFFDAAHFHRLAEALGRALTLALCHQDGQLVGGGLFLRHGPFAQYHLGAVADPYVAAAPAKQLIDAGRRHFHATGAEVLHLGGGRGAVEDSLFHFKVGFSPRRHAFRVWRWIIDRPAYEKLAAGRPEGAFFPAYRG